MAPSNCQKVSVPGRRLLHVLIDDYSRDDPERVWASIPQSTNLCDGYRDISYAMFANAINRLSWWLESSIGPAKPGIPTICYIGPADIRYCLIALASAKTGFKVLFSSHMNSLTGHLGLLERTDCHFMISAHRTETSDILAASKMQHLIIPEVEELVDSTSVEFYCYTKTYEEAQYDPWVIVHTSGTTGLPKPIYVNHGCVTAIDAHPVGGYYDGRPLRCNKRSAIDPVPDRQYVPFYPFHIIGSVLMLARTVFGGTIFVFPPSDGPPTADIALKVLENANVTSMFLSPVLCEEFAKNKDAWPRLANLSYIMYGGGTLSEAAGEKLSKVTRLFNTWGTTESSTGIQLATDREDWAWLAWHPDLNGYEFRPQGQGLYEMVIVQSPENEPRQPVFKLYPELSEWSTRDLYQKHPTKAHHWKYFGRIDELVYFAHGLKYHPLALETRLCSLPVVRGVIMLGHRRQQAALLIETTEPAVSMSHEELLTQIWPEVQSANSTAPSIAKIAKTHILFAKREKPFLRTSKGTVQRRLTIDLYASEIDELYATRGDHGAPLLTRLKQESLPIAA